jgi:hypothetical protein
MRNRKLTTVGLVLVLSLASLSFKCDNGPTPNSNGVQPDPLRKASEAAGAIAVSVREMIKVKRGLADQKKIDNAEELKLTQILLKVNSSDKVLVNRLKSLKTMPDATGKAELLNLLKEVTAAVNELNDSGVLGVKNAEAKDTLSKIVVTIQGSLSILQAFATQP